MTTQTETPRDCNREASREAATTRAATWRIPRSAPGVYVQRPHDYRRALEACRGGAPWAVADRLSALCHGIDGYLWWAAGVPVVLVEWAHELGYHHTTIGRALRKLVDAGVVERIGDRYRTVLGPVEHRRRAADNRDTTDNCASMHTDTIKERNRDSGVIRSETQPTTTEGQATQRESAMNQADNRHDEHRHRQAKRWYAFLTRPVPGMQRRYPLTEIVAAHADEILPGWHGRAYPPTLADEVRTLMQSRGMWASNRRDGTWTGGAISWALRCVAEDRDADERLDQLADERLDELADDRLDERLDDLADERLDELADERLDELADERLDELADDRLDDRLDQLADDRLDQLADDRLDELADDRLDEWQRQVDALDAAIRDELAEVLTRRDDSYSSFSAGFENAAISRRYRCNEASDLWPVTAIMSRSSMPASEALETNPLRNEPPAYPGPKPAMTATCRTTSDTASLDKPTDRR